MAHHKTNLYRILQVDPCAEPEVIQAAYKKLSLKYHPDVNRSPEATQKMQEINEAYRILGNPVLKADYDKRGVRQEGSDSSRPPNATGKKYGKAKTSYEVTICLDGFINVSVQHDNRQTRSIILAHKNNPRYLLNFRVRFSSSYIRAELYLGELMSYYLNYFEQNRVRFSLD
jgi:DnaJ-class molecular chaperone